MLSDHFIGQDMAVNQLQTAIDASKARGTILPHTLLVAPPGVGKTYISTLIARELDAPFDAITLPADPKVILDKMALHCGIVLLDEIHQANRKTLDMLLPFLIDGTFQYGRVTDQNPRLTFIVATTDAQKLPDAFRSRFRVAPVFAEYTYDEISEIVRTRALKDYEIALPPSVCDGLAHASLSSPRQAVHLLETLVDLRALDSETTVDEVVSHLGYTTEGLRPEHIRYLRALKGQGGVASQATIAKIVQEPESALRWVEKDLLRLRTISISSAGRELRSTAWEDQVSFEECADTPAPDSKTNPYTGERIS